MIPLEVIPQTDTEIGIKVKEFGSKSEAHLLKLGSAVLFPDHFLSNIGASIRFAVPIKLTHQ